MGLLRICLDKWPRGGVGKGGGPGIEDMRIPLRDNCWRRLWDTALTTRINLCPDLPFRPPLHSGTAARSPHITLIGSLDPDLSFQRTVCKDRNNYLDGVLANHERLPGKCSGEERECVFCGLGGEERGEKQLISPPQEVHPRNIFGGVEPVRLRSAFEVAIVSENREIPRHFKQPRASCEPLTPPHAPSNGVTPPPRQPGAQPHANIAETTCRSLLVTCSISPQHTAVSTHPRGRAAEVKGCSRYSPFTGAAVVWWTVYSLSSSPPAPPAHRQGEPGSNLSGVAPEFSHVGIVPDDAAGRWVFSGVHPFPPPSHSGAVPCSPHFNFIGSQDLDVKSRPNLPNSARVLDHALCNTAILRARVQVALLSRVWSGLELATTHYTSERKTKSLTSLEEGVKGRS
ncbi:hypothetical protein PR048_018860 [Dryococelus australis]|uniref:Uncharacterized protein n=1 Tax=Dryococelus australis TaxID=614101 RepID=A0ABQ9H1X8_9NEOP|nr:hypothetical protein PR048_018860 [Dryococelus australis]